MPVHLFQCHLYRTRYEIPFVRDDDEPRFFLGYDSDSHTQAHTQMTSLCAFGITWLDLTNNLIAKQANAQPKSMDRWWKGDMDIKYHNAKVRQLLFLHLPHSPPLLGLYLKHFLVSL